MRYRAVAFYLNQMGSQFPLNSVKKPSVVLDGVCFSPCPPPSPPSTLLSPALRLGGHNRLLLCGFLLPVAVGGGAPERIGGAPRSSGIYSPGSFSRPPFFHSQREGPGGFGCLPQVAGHLSGFPELLPYPDPLALRFQWPWRFHTIPAVSLNPAHTPALALCFNSHQPAGCVCHATSFPSGPAGCSSLSHSCGTLASVIHLILESPSLCF